MRKAAKDLNIGDRLWLSERKSSPNLLIRFPFVRPCNYSASVLTVQELPSGIILVKTVIGTFYADPCQMIDIDLTVDYLNRSINWQNPKLNPITVNGVGID